MERTQWGRDKRVVESLGETVKAGGYAIGTIGGSEVAGMSSRLPALLHRRRRKETHGSDAYSLMYK